jgi:hypothetical protein
MESARETIPSFDGSLTSAHQGTHNRRLIVAPMD